MKFCSNYGQSVVSHIPADDSRLCDICDHCNTIHYVNPRNVVGTVSAWNDQVLLYKRAVEPCYGFWILPAGFMEIGRIIAQATNQEAVGGASANVGIGELCSVLDVPHAHQVHLLYLAKPNDLDFTPGEESLEVAFFDEVDIPQDDLTFPTIIYTLRCFFADHAADKLAGDSLRLHAFNIYKPMCSAAIDTPATTPQRPSRVIHTMIAWLDPHDPFPPINRVLGSESGASDLLAAGTELSLQRLLVVCWQDIFPRHAQGQPVLWWSADSRMVLRPGDFCVSTMFRETLYRMSDDLAREIRIDHGFRETVVVCTTTARPGQRSM